MPAAASTRFVLRPLSESLDESFLVGVGDEPIDIGRLAGDICFEGDAFLSPLHARFEMIDDTLQVTDLDSLNGVWLRVRGEISIDVGALFLCGQQVLRLDERTVSPRSATEDGTARVGAPVHSSGLELARTGCRWRGSRLVITCRSAGAGWVDKWPISSSRKTRS